MKFVAAYRTEFGAAPLCAVINLPVSTFYARAHRAPLRRRWQTTTRHGPALVSPTWSTATLPRSDHTRWTSIAATPLPVAGRPGRTS